MHPKKQQQKYALSNTERKTYLKLQLSLRLVTYDILPVNGVGLFWNTHTYTHMLTYLPRTHTG